MVLDAQHHLPIHLDKAPIAVVGETIVATSTRQPYHHSVVEPEIEHGVHHARHRDARPRAHRDEERIVGVSEPRAERMLDLGKRALDLFSQVIRIGLAVGIEVAADLCGDRETGRHGQPEIAHLGETRSFAAEQVPHVGAALGSAVAEPVDPLGHPQLILRSARSRRLDSSSPECATANAADSLATWVHHY